MLEENFNRILETMAQVGAGAGSPKFFIIYAHENAELPDYPANAAVVQKFIDWFKRLGLDVDSDRSPHGWAADRGPEIAGASNDILKNQLCLLPPDWDSRNVELVIIFGSQLLNQYIKDEQDITIDGGATYTKTLVDKCWELDKARVARDTWCEGTAYDEIAKIQHDFASKMGSTFHHVLTELAFVQFRNQYQKSPSMIPVLLDESACLDAFFSEDLLYKDTLLRESVNHEDLHKSLFKIILRFESVERNRFLIEAMRECFTKCREALQTKVTLERTQYRVDCEGIMLKTLQHLVRDPRYQRLERQITLPEIRKILNLHLLMDLSMIQRVSGDILPGECRDVDLCVDSADETKRKLVKLHNLFDEMEIDGKGKITPRRILIRGLPGVGKSTLSRRIAYEYSRHTFLNKADLVVRLPLRNLELSDDLAQLLFAEFFSLEPKGRELSQKLAETILSPAKRREVRILFVLDGLDETTGFEGGSRSLLSHLIEQDCVVITSRFGSARGKLVKHIDLKLQAIGLSLDAIWNYLDNRTVVPSVEDAEAIRQHIEENETLQDLIRIPIHLDMLCYSWDELKKTGDTAGVPTTTEIYQAIAHKLWRKDIPRLNKSDHGQPLTASIVEAVRDPRRLERVVQAELSLMGMLATILLDKGRTQLSDMDISTTITQLEAESGALPLSLESHLPMLSFLRLESDINSQRTFSFIHLTFQEYFAACYLLRNPTALKKSLASHKLNHRFAVVWQFVAGLLPTEHLGVKQYFELLDDGPIDFGGGEQVRLVMRCLKECQRKMDNHLKQRIYKNIWDWFEIAKRRSPAIRWDKLDSNNGISCFPRRVRIRSMAESLFLILEEIAGQRT
ncbi:hypothetical protein V8F06_012538 [Rhypophila decipiens]